MGDLTSIDDENGAVYEQEAPAYVPLPKQKMAALLCMIVSEGISTSILLPFVAFMVADFGTPLEEVGSVSGYVTSAFFLTQMCSIIFVGKVSDRVGRKPMIVWGTFVNAVTSIGFGTSKTFLTALMWRALQGLGNGNTAVGKTYLTEITVASNQAFAFSAREAGYAFGGIMGFFLGGVLARPCVSDEDALLCNSLFMEYPYLLPCLTTGALSFMSMILSTLLLTETVVRNQAGVDHREEYAAVGLDTDVDVEGLELVDMDADADSELVAPEVEEDTDNSLCVPHVVKPICFYIALSFLRLFFDEMLVVSVVTPSERGGFDFVESDTGIVMAMASAGMVVIQVLFYARVDTRFGTAGVYSASLAVMAVFASAIPLLNPVLGISKVLFYPLLVIFITLFISASTFAFSSINLMVSNSATGKSLAMVTSVAFTCASSARFLAPLAGGNLFSLCFSASVPFLSFFTVTVLSLICLAASCKFLDSSFNTRRIKTPPE
jgi:MFS family permease